jgi:hypothetical protein
MAGDAKKDEERWQHMEVTYNIGWAVDCMKAGRRVCRAGWNGKGMWLRMRGSDAATEQMGEPYQAFIEMKTVQGTLVPWLCSQSDLLAEDWEVAS